MYERNFQSFVFDYNFFFYFSGYVALFLTLVAFVTGPLGLQKFISLRFIHMGLGLTALSVSSICVCLGFYTSHFKHWAGNIITYMLISFVVSFTCCICAVTIVHGALNMK